GRPRARRTRDGGRAGPPRTRPPAGGRVARRDASPDAQSSSLQVLSRRDRDGTRGLAERPRPLLPPIGGSAQDDEFATLQISVARRAVEIEHAVLHVREELEVQRALVDGA